MSYFAETLPETRCGSIGGYEPAFDEIECRPCEKCKAMISAVELVPGPAYKLSDGDCYDYTHEEYCEECRKPLACGHFGGAAWGDNCDVCSAIRGIEAR